MSSNTIIRLWLDALYAARTTCEPSKSIDDCSPPPQEISVKVKESFDNSADESADEKAEAGDKTITEKPSS
jgi:hypothetical protein